MFRPHQKREIPGWPITASGLNRFNKEVSWFSQIRGGAGIHVIQSPGGPLVRMPNNESIYATIDGPCNELGGYPWSQQLFLPDGTWMPSGRNGGNVQGDPNYDPTYERRTGSTTVMADGRRYVMTRAPTSGEWLFAARMTKCDPTTTGVFGTVTNACGGDSPPNSGPPLSGVEVTVKDSDGNVVATVLTDENGAYVIPIATPGTYTMAFVIDRFFPGFDIFSATCAPLGFVITKCGESVGRNAILFPTVVPVNFTGIECNCPVTHPITVSVTQTSGGTFSKTCVISDSIVGCNLDLPAPMPFCVEPFVFKIIWSAPGFVDKTTIFTIGEQDNPFNCPSGATIALLTPPGNWCCPANDCFTAVPTSVNVTLASGNPNACPPDGTYACALVSTAGCTATYQLRQAMTCPIVGPTVIEIDVLVANSDCTGSGTGGVVLNNAISMGFTGGSTSCPIAFTVSDPVSGYVATVHE